MSSIQSPGCCCPVVSVTRAGPAGQCAPLQPLHSPANWEQNITTDIGHLKIPGLGWAGLAGGHGTRRLASPFPLFLDIKPLCSNLTITINVRVAGLGCAGRGRKWAVFVSADSWSSRRGAKTTLRCFLSGEVDSLDRAAVTREPPAREVKLRGHSLY